MDIFRFSADMLPKLRLLFQGYYVTRKTEIQLMVLYLVTETQPHTVYELVSSSESGLDREAYLSLPRWKKIFSIAANQEPMVLQVS